jgi:hypothetical protein
MYPKKAKAAQKKFSSYFGPFIPKDGPNDLVRSLFLSLEIGPYIRLTYTQLQTFGDLFGSIWGCPNFCEKTKVA